MGNCKRLHCLSDRKSKINENEVDLSHFLVPESVIGIGGFGMVRHAIKVTGNDRKTLFAVKSLSKAVILKRSSGLAAVMTELRALALLVDSKFICNIHYAFQDEKFLYMVISLAAGGDLRFALKFSQHCRFSESKAQFYIAQVILAVSSCHAANILHRGNVALI
jgi:serine/threonine protein kinase